MPFIYPSWIKKEQQKQRMKRLRICQKILASDVFKIQLFSAATFWPTTSPIIFKMPKRLIMLHKTFQLQIGVIFIFTHPGTSTKFIFSPYCQLWWWDLRHGGMTLLVVMVPAGCCALCRALGEGLFGHWAGGRVRDPLLLCFLHLIEKSKM